ncbi:hypothetical protein GCM10008179_28680 [Hansschlegelia plantiphila]|uniref:Uncharacterized protein n=1 Tax=Hansschlegelia plantiphila TaxID=374655 RepID=A0A9W6J4T7_9HYPH|nr:hypothetical protein GCM10008179_28680 [Hansschlegelia plantiphila]
MAAARTDAASKPANSLRPYAEIVVMAVIPAGPRTTRRGPYAASSPPFGIGFKPPRNFIDAISLPPFRINCEPVLLMGAMTAGGGVTELDGAL